MGGVGSGTDGSDDQETPEALNRRCLLVPAPALSPPRARAHTHTHAHIVIA